MKTRKVTEVLKEMGVEVVNMEKSLTIDVGTGLELGPNRCGGFAGYLANEQDGTWGYVFQMDGTDVLEVFTFAQLFELYPWFKDALDVDAIIPAKVNGEWRCIRLGSKRMERW